MSANIMRIVSNATWIFPWRGVSFFDSSVQTTEPMIVGMDILLVKANRSKSALA